MPTGPLASDLRFFAREFRRRPYFTLTAIFSLAIGIGATSAVFSVIYAVLINPYPYPDAGRIVELHLQDKASNDHYVILSGAQLNQLRQARSIESMVGITWWNLTTTDGDLPEDVQGVAVSTESPNYFGITALKGRWFIPSDAPPGEDPQRVAVVSYEFWQRYFVGDPNIIGKKLRLVHETYEVIGVMPPRFKWGDGEVYLPLKATQDSGLNYGCSIKLRPGVTPAQADAELQPLIEQFAKESPSHYPDTFRVELRSIVDLYARPLGPPLYLLLGAVASLLLIGCANVSILLLARGAQRQQELAVRAAVGASRWRMMRQLFTESLAVATAGAAIGILFAWRGLSVVTAFVPIGSFPSESTIRMNVPVLLFSIGLAFFTTIVFGLWPAVRLSRPEIARLMQTNSRRVAGSAHAYRTHGMMVSAQVALTILLLAAASAAGKGFLRLVNTDLGYDPRNAMSLPIPVHQNSHVSWQDRSQYFERLRARLAAMPEVVEAAVSTNATPPLPIGSVRIEILSRQQAEKPDVRVNLISPEYFSVLRISLLQGRLWDHTETMRGAQLAIINQTMARQYWPDGNAIGQQIRIPVLKNDPPYFPAATGSADWLQIIGIVGDTRNNGLRNPVKPAVFVPFTLRMPMYTQILVRTRVPPLSILRDMRRQIVEIDPEQQTTQVRDLEGWIMGQREYSQQRLIAGLFGLFSILALTLAAVGLYSVVTYTVATRINEFGIRVALGAKAADVFRIVLTSTATSVGTGLAAGLILSFAFDKIAIKWLAESLRAPLTLAGATLLFLTAALLASIVPARRASTVDPMISLRYE
jgi:putative ABC transport system permease protein